MVFVRQYSDKEVNAARDLWKEMAGTTGLEPAASAVTGQRSNQLNYVPAARDELNSV